MLRVVRPLVVRVVALVSVIALSLGAWVKCAGWQNTADARMACCEQEAQCPMHHSGSDGSARHAAPTQSQADTCCALSEQSPTTPANSPQAAQILAAMPTIAVVVSPPDAAVARHIWRPLVPLQPDGVPRHVLLSVFLI
jgi:hypothetical protein